MSETERKRHEKARALGTERLGALSKGTDCENFNASVQDNIFYHVSWLKCIQGREYLMQNAGLRVLTCRNLKPYQVMEVSADAYMMQL